MLFMRKIVIIGNGISGVTTARHIRKRSEDRIVLISAETPYFFSRTALMYVYMGHMQFEHTQPYEDWFWEKNRIELMQDYVQSVDTDAKELQLRDGGVQGYDVLVLATGSKPNRFGWPGQDLDGVQGLYSYQDLQLLEANTHPPKAKPEERKVKRAVIVGGGLIGVELAEMLLTRGIEVTFLVREDRFWGNVLPEEEGNLVARHMRDHHVDLRFGTELKEILPGDAGRVKSIVTSTGEEIPCELVGLTAGVRPNIDFLRDSGIEIDRGILVNRKLETGTPEVYAVGDCAQFRNPVPGRRPIEQVWYTGRMMGEVTAENITGGNREYDPGPWFNSAKFFDVEYQTYGTVPAHLSEGQKDFYWAHEEGLACVKVIFNESDNKLLGINTFGIRMRHELFDRWLREGRDVYYVLSHLKDANFDPEFYRPHEGAILEKFNAENGTQLVPAKRSWKRIFSPT